MADTMFLLPSSISANNKGVLLLEVGDFEKASLQFKKALEMIGTVIRAKEELRNKHLREFSTTSMPSLQWSTMAGDPRRCHNYSSSPYVFRRGIIIDEDDEDRFSIAHMGSMIYNFALASHLRSLDLEARGSDSLKKSLKLYIRSSLFLEKTPFYVAILNNMLIIRHDIGSYDSAKHLSHRLVEELNKGVGTIHKECFDFITWNLVTLRQPTLSAAA